MRLGIGLGVGPDAAKAARSAARQALKGCPRPTAALVFGGVRLDQRALHAALVRELDASILLGCSSYAEITPAGVSRDSVAVLLMDLPAGSVRLAQARTRGRRARGWRARWVRSRTGARSLWSSAASAAGGRRPC